MSHSIPAHSALLRLLCAVARAELRDADQRTLDALRPGDLDRATLPTALFRHGLVPLATRHLLDGGRAHALPSVVRLWMSAVTKASTAKQTRALIRLKTITGAAAAAGLDVMPYKGALLGHQLYDDFAMRQQGDVDLLVRPAHAEAVIRLLLDVGLRATSGVDADGGVPLTRHRHACVFADPDNGQLFDVHWRLRDRMYGVDLPLAWLMESPRLLAVGDAEVHAMHGERLLLALCLHGAAHQWERLIWVADLAELLRREPALDWTLIRARAVQLRFTRSLGAALTLVRDLLGVPVDGDGPRRLMAETGAAALAARLHQHFLDPTMPLGMADRFRLGWFGRQGVRDRLAFGWGAMTHLSSRDLATTPESRVPGLATTRRAVRLLRTAAADRGRPGAPR